MFLLRCGFWLSVVYAAMFFGMPGRAVSGGASVAPTVSAASAAAGKAVAGAIDLCGDRAAECVRRAAELTGLVQTVLASAPTYEKVSPSPRHSTAAGGAGDAVPPLPVPDPRRRSKLTPPV